MNEIKVTVSYEQPTTSKFDALMAEYNAAKKVADETVAYYKPLADAAEEAKMMAILEQLETIKEYADTLGAILSSDVQIYVTILSVERGNGYSGCLYFKIYRSRRGNYDITWDGASFNIENLKANPRDFTAPGYNILGKWDEWKMYERLEKNAIEQLQRQIDRQKTRGQQQINRLNNIQK